MSVTQSYLPQPKTRISSHGHVLPLWVLLGAESGAISPLLGHPAEASRKQPVSPMARKQSRNSVDMSVLQDTVPTA